MTLFTKGDEIEKAAAEDAALGINSVDEHIVRTLGARPTFDPVDNHEHGQVAAGLQRGREINDWRDDARRVEQDASRLARPWSLASRLAACLVVEMVGSIRVASGLGVGERERLWAAAGLSVTVIGLTALATKFTGDSPVSSSTTPGPRRFGKAALVVGLYGLLVVSVAVVRLRASAEEGSVLEQLAETIIMLGCSIGPAFYAEHLLKKWAPALTVSREASRLRREIRVAGREEQVSQQFLVRHARKLAAWDAEAARLRARYLVAHRVASASLSRSS